MVKFLLLMWFYLFKYHLSSFVSVCVVRRLRVDLLFFSTLISLLPKVEEPCKEVHSGKCHFFQCPFDLILPTGPRVDNSLVH